MFLYTSPFTTNGRDPYSYDNLLGGYITAESASENQEFFFDNNLKNYFSFELSNAQIKITCNKIFNNANQIYFVGRYSYFVMFPNPIQI